jgi:hypothetical protein
MNAEPCDLSGFPPAQCGCRIHAPKEPAAPPVGTSIQAHYDGRCDLCDTQVIPGEQIVRTTHGRWVHEDCT